MGPNTNQMIEEHSPSSPNPDAPGQSASDSPISPEEMIEEGKPAAILAYVPFMCFVPLIKMRHNPFALHHGKQGLLIFLLEIIALVFLIPKISDFFWAFVIILCIGLAVAGVLYSVQGREWKIPFIGDLADKLKI